MHVLAILYIVFLGLALFLGAVEDGEAAGVGFAVVALCLGAALAIVALPS